MDGDRMVLTPCKAMERKESLVNSMTERLGVLLRVCRLGMGSTKKILFALIFATLVLGGVVLSVGITDFHGKYRRNARPAEVTWTWSCENRRCVRREWPNANPLAWSSLSRCRATCSMSSTVWPKPSGPISFGPTTSAFSITQTTFKIERAVNFRNSRMLREAFNIFRDDLYALIPEDTVSVVDGPSDVVLQITVFIRLYDDTDLTLDTDEGYSLNVVKSENGDVVRAAIESASFYGARHALETLSQLIWWEVNDAGLATFNVLNNASIEDRPRFKYRGVMIDTSRNFMSLEALRRTIDGMAASKLNTLHLHLTDSQSFSFQSPRHPQMSRYGAYSSEKVYTADNLVDLASYARVRGVRLLPEVDAPAHAAAGWQWGEKEHLGPLAVCINSEPHHLYCGEPPCGQLNPSNNNTYIILRGIYEDLIDMTGTRDVFHVGGDEVNMNCWASSPDIYTPEEKLDPIRAYDNKVTEFHNRAYVMLKEANAWADTKNVIVWSTTMRPEQMLVTFPPEKYIIQEWGGSNWAETRLHLSLNYRIIISHVDAWYLDCGLGKWISGRDEPCSPLASWQKVYSHRPWSTFRGNALNLTIGGEACLWSEKVDDRTVDARVWPRAAALAERLWSDPHYNFRPGTRNESQYMYEEALLRDATMRLAIHRERLVGRGINADVLWPEWCNANPGAC